MLFIYVYFLFQMSPSVTVLFLAGPAGSLDEKKRADRIVGAVSAQTFCESFSASVHGSPEFRISIRQLRPLIRKGQCLTGCLKQAWSRDLTSLMGD